jgi:hypothetical protein
MYTKTMAGGALMMAALTASAPAMATPGLGSEVYGATVKAGEPEFEARYGQIDGKAADGTEVLKLEAAYGVTRNLRVAVVGEFTRDPGGPRRADAAAIEVIYALGRLGGIDVAVYGEYEIGFLGPDKVETKLVLQRRTGPWDLRLNVIAEKALAAGEPVELGYAASVDHALVGDVRIGVQAYGELGTFRDFAPCEEHFVGPVAKFEIEGLGPELGVELGYLFALGAAKDDASGQFRLRLELEF